jgi:hypothetical protein
MATLKTNYKDDVFAGNRKYRIVDNGDGTVSFEDQTEYTQTGDSFGATDVNGITTQVNANTSAVAQKANQSALNSLAATVNTKASQSDLNNLASTVSGKANQSDLNALSNTVSGHTTQISTLSSQKADKTQLGTQVTYNLSGTTLYITTK